MSTAFEYTSERREFVRTNTDIPLRYKFLSRDIDLGTDQIYEGKTSNISGAGCLLSGKVPSLSWIPALLMGKIHLGVNLLMPSLDHPIKALCQVSWVEAIPPRSDRCVLGLKFIDVRKQDQDEIMKYLIKAQMTK
ncbi:MAG: PilZ domain-containing protein [Planctomycetota bacterium]